MTELIPGKRYRVTVEGVADSSGFLVYDKMNGLSAAPSFLQHAIIKLLPDPLPTTPGSVVEYQGRIYIRAIPTSSQTYVWTPLDNLGHYFDEGYDLQGATVLFDAGAKRA